MLFTMSHVQHMCKLVHNQSLRQGKAKQLCLNTTPFFPKRKRRAVPGAIRTRDILRVRQTLYQLSHRGSSAGQAELYTRQRASLLMNSISVVRSMCGSMYVYVYMYMYIYIVHSERVRSDIVRGEE